MLVFEDTENFQTFWYKILIARLCPEHRERQPLSTHNTIQYKYIMYTYSDYSLMNYIENVYSVNEQWASTELELYKYILHTIHAKLK